MSRAKVLIVDDNTLLKEVVTAFLMKYDDIQVVGEASDGFEAIAMAREIRPDVILMDNSMPRLGGYEATIEIKKTNPEIKILVFTLWDDKEYVSRFFEAGVSGYLLKQEMASGLVSAIRAVNRGEIYV